MSLPSKNRRDHDRQIMIGGFLGID